MLKLILIIVAINANAEAPHAVIVLKIYYIKGRIYLYEWEYLHYRIIECI